MKWPWIGLLALVVICVVAGLIQGQSQNEGFATIDHNTAKAQRQQLQWEGERRYNDLGRIQNATLPANAVSDALNQIIPVSTSTGPASRLTTKSMGLFGANDDGTGKSGDGVEQTGVLAQKIAFCESVTDTACGILTDPRYSECGICHKDGVNSKGKNFRGGMFISADDQIRANEVAKTNGTRAQYKPTVGTCDSANFTVMEETCKWKGRTMECEAAGVPTSNNECGQCFGGSGAMIYTGAKPTKFTAILNVSHPGFQNIGGNGIVVENLTTGEQTKFAPSKQQSVLDPKEAYLQLQEGDNLKISIYGVPAIWCAWFSSADGKRIVSLDNGVQSISPQNGFVIAGDKRSKKITKPMAAVSGWDAYKAKVPSTVLWYMRRNEIIPPAILFGQYDVTVVRGSNTWTAPSDVTTVVQELASRGGAIYVNNLMNADDKADNSRNKLTLKMDNGTVRQASEKDTVRKLQSGVTINVTMPATLGDPFYDVDLPKCPAGPMVLTEAGAGMMGANSCYKADGSFNPTIHCLTQLFEAAGGTSAGTLYPDTAAKAAALVVNGSLDDTIDRLNDLGSIALYGTDNNGAPSGFAAQKDAALKFLGIVMSNPCDGPTSSTGPHSAECLNYLWKTSGNAAPLGNGVNPDTLPYDYCHPAGTEFPLKSESNQQTANDMGSVQAVRTYYNGIFVRSQDSSDFDAQAAAMRACYGTKINKPSGPPPVCPPSTNTCDWIAKAAAATWKQIEGTCANAAIGNDDYIISTTGNQAFGRTIAGPWVNLYGGLSQVDTKGGIHVGVANIGQYAGQYGGPIYKATNGNNWTPLPGAAKYISIGADGEFWCVNNPGNIYRWNGTNDWILMPGGALQVAVGDKDNVWIVGGNSILHNWTGSTWVQSKTPALIKYVSVSAGGRRIAALGVDGNIYASADKGGSWKQIPGNFDGYVSVSDNHIIAGNKSNSTLYIRSFNCSNSTQMVAKGADGNYRGENGTTFTINGNRLTGTGNSAELTGVIQYAQSGSDNVLMVTSGKGDRFSFIHKGNTLTTPSSGDVYTRVS